MPTDCPFQDWDEFFDVPYSAELFDPIRIFMDYFMIYFELKKDDLDFDRVLRQTALIIDYHALESLEGGNVGQMLDDAPRICLSSLNLAATQSALKARIVHGMHDLEILPKCVRIYNYQKYVRFKDLKSSMVGRFVSVKGTAVRVSSIKPLVTRMEFRCSSCDREQVLTFPDGKYQAPTKCIGYGCKSRLFQPQRGVSSQTQSIDWQRIRIQEKLPNDQADTGRVPRTIDCEVTRDLVDLIVPGDVVVCSGLVKLLATEESKGKNGTSQMYYLYIDANSMGKLAGRLDDEDSKDSTGKDFIQFSDRDIQGIQEIFNYEGDLFHLLVHSVCPAIYGHELVKAAILLTLFGGKKRNHSPHQSYTRADSHLLIVGDPGLGKSQMLMSAVKLAPRGVYVGGNTTTTAGLTVTLSKDADNGDTSLEAGALVLGDQGVCCIDEFDKMNEHHALLEAMEQQSISIAKAGMVCTLPTRTSIIAAANPVGGHYDKSKTVAENLKMNSALLSRFDLIFILLDNPNEDIDKFLSDHIIKMHSGINVERPQFDPQETQETVEEYSLKDRLRSNQKGLDLVPVSLLRKYISYARTYCQPTLSPEASEVIREFYLELRRSQSSQDAAPITTRQLESIIRLSEARAKCELRTVVKKSDAIDVIQLMRMSLYDTYQTTNGNLDFSRSQMGTGSSRQGSSKKFIQQLQQVSQRNNSKEFSRSELETIANRIII